MNPSPKHTHKSLPKIKNLYDSISDGYDNEEGHALTEEEKQIWKTKIIDKYFDSSMEHILDVGSGTGLLTRFLFELELSNEIIGLEYSEEMVKVAKRNHSSIQYLQGDTHQPDIFEKDTFDCIISRQVACHFHDPLAVFHNWSKWLKSEGYVIVMDGFWSRKGWSNDDLVDSLPISCVQSRATIAYLLEKSGFEMIENDFFDYQKEKYFVIAKKSI